MAADSLGGDVSTYHVEIRKDPKVFTKGEFIIGYTSSFRMGDLLQYRFVPPPLSEGSLSEYMRTTFMDAVRTCFKDGGFAQKNNEKESGGDFIVGVRGRLFIVEDDYQVSEPLDGWAAVGSGTQIARGALFAIQKIDHLIVTRELEPCELLVVALEAAAHCSAYVRGPFHCLSTENKGAEHE